MTENEHQSCEAPAPDLLPDTGEIKKLLTTAKIIAIVGLSPKPDRDSYRVAEYLKNHGYKIVPVNPGQTEILGEKCYPSLKDLPFAVDIADIFRAPDAVGPLADEILGTAIPAVWLQLGVINNDAARKLKNAGRTVIMNRCIKIEHAKYL